MNSFDEQPQFTILNVDTYRYEGSYDQLSNDKEDIWEHKRFFWEIDPHSLATDLLILQSEILDYGNVKILWEIMDFIEQKIQDDINNKNQELIYLHLLEDFKETQMYQAMIKTLSVFNDAVRQRNTFEVLKNKSVDKATLECLQNMFKWMMGERFGFDQIKIPVNIFKELLEDFQKQESDQIKIVSVVITQIEQLQQKGKQKRKSVSDNSNLQQNKSAINYSDI